MVATTDRRKAIASSHQVELEQQQLGFFLYSKTMTLLQLFLAELTLAAISVGIVEGGKAVCKDNFFYNGKSCSWIEQRETSSKRILSIKCDNTLKVKYGGDPHKCKWYLTNGNQCTYYGKLVSELIRKQFDQNKPLTVSYDKHGCGNVIFKKV